MAQYLADLAVAKHFLISVTGAFVGTSAAKFVFPPAAPRTLEGDLMKAAKWKATLGASEWNAAIEEAKRKLKETS